MKNDFTLVWSFRNRIDVLGESIRTADATCPKSVDFCLIDAASTDESIRSLRQMVNGIDGRRIRICESTYRSSLGEAWNMGMMLTENRYVIFASSDVKFLNSGWYDKISNALQRGNEYVMLQNHAVFGIDKRCISRLGWFDEAFGNGPHFDCDYMIRASEARIKLINIANKDYYEHYDTLDTSIKRWTSDVADRLPMHDPHNENVFRAKWASSWPGWQSTIDASRAAGAFPSDGLPHPPVDIKQAKRTRAEIDPHPFYTKKFQ